MTRHNYYLVKDNHKSKASQKIKMRHRKTQKQNTTKHKNEIPQNTKIDLI